MDELIEKLTTYVEGQTSTLSDADYLEVLEGVSSNLDMSVAAKREEQGS